jgi:hypothetical protein
MRKLIEVLKKTPLKNSLIKLHANVHHVFDIYYYKKLVKSNEKLWKLVEYFNKTSNSTGIDYGDIYYLYTKVKKIKPNFLLEFSTGASTAYIALALKEIQELDSAYMPKYYALEDHQGWIEHQRNIFPKDLSRFVEIIKSDITVVKMGGVDMVEYSNMPELPYEFIHVDGPNEDYGNQRVKNTIDILNTINNNVLVVFDNRMASTHATINNIDNDKYIWDRTIKSFLIGNNIIKNKNKYI